MADFEKHLQDLRDDGLVDEDEDCCVLTARLLARAADMESTFRPGTKWWEQANVWDIEEPYSSVDAASQVAHRKAGRSCSVVLLDRGPITWKRIRHHLRQNTWYLFQGWRENGTGHTFMMYFGSDLNADATKIESSRAKGIRVTKGAYPSDELVEYQRGIGFAELW